MNPYIYMEYNMIYIYMDSSAFIWIDIWIHVEHILTISNFRVLKSWGIPSRHHGYDTRRSSMRPHDLGKLHD